MIKYEVGDTVEVYCSLALERTQWQCGIIIDVGKCNGSTLYAVVVVGDSDYRLYHDSELRRMETKDV